MSGAGAVAAQGPKPSTGRLLFGIEVAVLGLLFLGVAVWKRWRWNRLRAAAMAPGVAAALAGVFLISQSQNAGTARQGTPTFNPFPPTAESLNIGRQIYAQHCAICHGVTGRGDGPSAASLNPPPLNLQVHCSATRGPGHPSVHQQGPAGHGHARLGEYLLRR